MICQYCQRQLDGQHCPNCSLQGYNQMSLSGAENSPNTFMAMNLRFDRIEAQLENIRRALRMLHQ